MTEEFDDDDLLMEDFIVIDDPPETKESSAEAIIAEQTKVVPEVVPEEPKIEQVVAVPQVVPAAELLELSSSSELSSSQTSDANLNIFDDTSSLDLAESILEDFCTLDSDPESDTCEQIKENKTDVVVQESTTEPIQEQIKENKTDIVVVEESTTEPIQEQIKENKTDVVVQESTTEPIQEQIKENKTDMVGEESTTEPIQEQIKENKTDMVVQESTTEPIQVIDIVQKIPIKIRDRAVEWEYFIAEHIQPFIQKYRMANNNFVKDIFKQQNLINCIQSLPENQIVFQSGLELGYSLSLFLIYHDTIRVDVMDDAVYPFTKELRKEFIKVFGNRVTFYSSSLEHTDLSKKKAALIHFNQPRCEHALFVDLQKAWKHSAARCIWIVNHTDRCETLKGLRNILSRKDFVHELDFTLAPAHHWIGQTEK